LSICRERSRLTIGRLCRRQEIQKRLDLRTISNLLLKNLSSGVSRHTLNRDALAQTSIPPTLQCEEEEGAVMTANVSWTTFTKAGQVQRTANGEPRLILNSEWSQGRDLDLASLIQQIQNPPMRKIGVLDLESFYPSKERFSLVMALNNLIASPGFGAWTEGEPLDIGKMLHGPTGKPRVSIFSIAHLGDAERMFFVSLLLNQVLGLHVHAGRAVVQDEDLRVHQQCAGDSHALLLATR